MKNKFYFNSISPKVSFQEIERKMLDYWKKNNVEKKYLKKNTKPGLRK
jgi:hypothetical protein